MIRIGTSHFVSRICAQNYYRSQGYSFMDAVVVVDEKIADGEIHIGAPLIREGQTLDLIDGETRYAIVEA